MRPNIGWFFLAAALAATTADAAGPQSFDGTWQTTISCSAARDALGYSFRFDSQVRNGVLHGSHGTPGSPSSLAIDGTIPPSGVARLYVKGLTGSKEYVPGRDTPRGTDYGYDVDATFDPAAGTGSGTRIEGRPCTLQFVRT